MLRWMRPNGGHKWHMVPEGQRAALCGYSPSSPNRGRMRPRGRWASEIPPTQHDQLDEYEYCCAECLKVRDKEREAQGPPVDPGLFAEEEGI